MSDQKFSLLVESFSRGKKKCSTKRKSHVGKKKSFTAKKKKVSHRKKISHNETRKIKILAKRNEKQY